MNTKLKGVKKEVRMLEILLVITVLLLALVVFLYFFNANSELSVIGASTIQ